MPISGLAWNVRLHHIIVNIERNETLTIDGTSGQMPGGDGISGGSQVRNQNNWGFVERDVDLLCFR